MLISVIIPVYNEQTYIKKILQKINLIKNLKKEIIVVNDGSKDETLKILKEDECNQLYSKLISYEKNMGKGFAVRQGIKQSSGDIVIIQDADLEYNPNNFEILIEPIIKNEAKVVYGSRVLPGANRERPKTIDTKIRVFANVFLTLLSNLLNGQKLTDCHTCYKVFKSEVIKKITLKDNGFSFCPEVTAKISKLGIKIIEVPIDYFGRSHKQGKKISFLDGFIAIYAIFKHNLFR